MISVFFAAALSMVPLEEIALVLADHAQPKYSQDEEMLAYLAPDKRGAYNLHVDGKCLTHERRTINTFFWEPDGEHLLYLYDANGDENYHLYRTDLYGCSEDLTPYFGVHVEFLGINYQYPDEALIRMNVRDSRYLDCYRLNLKTGELKAVHPQMNHLEQVMSPDLLIPQVALEFLPKGEKNLVVYENEAWHSIWKLDPDDWYVSMGGFYQGKRKVILFSSTGMTTRSLFAVDIKTGARELLFSHPKLDALRAYFHPENGKLQAVLVRDGALEWHFFDPQFQKEIQSIQEILGRGEIQLLSRLSRQRKWFVSHRQDDMPTAYYLFDKERGDLELVLQEAPELLQYAFGKMEPFHFRASDGQIIQGYFLRPPEGEPPYPTLLQPHGGPHVRDVWGFFPQAQYWASQGYASLFINYRGSFGFGKKFMMADYGEWGKRVFQDLIDGKHFGEKQGLIDPERTIIKGGSYGGYLALLGITLTPNEFIGGIAEFPIVEPSTWMPQGYVSWGFNYDKLFREAAIGAISPLSYACQIEVPLLMMHSTNDFRVRLNQSQKMAESLEFYQIPFTYHVLPGDGHGYLDPSNRLFYFQEVEKFLRNEMPLF